MQKLEVCSVCRALLDSYSERRKKEREDIHKVESYHIISLWLVF